VGSGPNGFSAAILLARAGLSTTMIEAEQTIGGGARTAELTLPGFQHDICSAAHPMGVASPVFATFPLAKYGLEWIHPPAPLAHPFDDGSSALLYPSVNETAEQFPDSAAAYRRWMGPIVSNWKELCPDLLAPLGWPTHPFTFARFGMLAGWPATVSAKLFRDPRARALFGGIAAHSILPLSYLGSGAFGWVLGGAGHAVGWPVARGGSQAISNALRAYFESLGGTVISGRPISKLDELKNAGIVLLDVTPRQALKILGPKISSRYASQLSKYRYGPGVYKIDWALSAPIPWRSKDCALAATVHLAGSFEEIVASEAACWANRHEENPFILVTQPSLFDRTRAPAGKHTAWGYCHVPNGSTEDMTARIERQMERFAPGFRDCILERRVLKPADLEAHNANLVGGDISGGAATLRQLFFRPTPGRYRTPIDGVYLCSSSTPPGGGVHGMCGYHAARMALQDAGLPTNKLAAA